MPRRLRAGVLAPRLFAFASPTNHSNLSLCWPSPRPPPPASRLPPVCSGVTAIVPDLPPCVPGYSSICNVKRRNTWCNATQFRNRRFSEVDWWKIGGFRRQVLLQPRRTASYMPCHGCTLCSCVASLSPCALTACRVRPVDSFGLPRQGWQPGPNPNRPTRH